MRYFHVVYSYYLKDSYKSKYSGFLSFSSETYPSYSGLRESLELKDEVDLIIENVIEMDEEDFMEFIK